MLKIQDGEITIHRRDTFSFLCVTNTEDVIAEKLEMIVVDEKEEIVMKKQAKMFENGIYFSMNSCDTNIAKGIYNYYIVYHHDDENSTTIANNSLIVRNSAC